MKRLDDGKVSLVEFLRSIKFARNNTVASSKYGHAHLAHFTPQARSGQPLNLEDTQLIRSAN